MIALYINQSVLLVTEMHRVRRLVRVEQDSHHLLEVYDFLKLLWKKM